MTQIQIILNFFIFLCCLVAIDGDTDQDLCKLCPPGLSSQHIFCLFPNPGPADKPGCRNVDTSITNEEFRKKVLNWHNNYRNKFAEGSWKTKYKENGKEIEYSQDPNFPRAANMRFLMYDNQLEKLAMRNVLNCYNEHEQCRNVERFTYGQNLGNSGWTDKSYVDKDSEMTWEAWVGEMVDFDMADLSNFGKGKRDPNKPIGHFTAATWATTRVVGCAQATFFDGKFYRIAVACNYGPSGNVISLPMYLTGSPGSQCPNGTKAGYDSKYPNLCGGEDPADSPYLDREASGKSNHVKSDYGIILFLLGFVEIFKIFFYS